MRARDVRLAWASVRERERRLAACAGVCAWAVAVRLSRAAMAHAHVDDGAARGAAATAAVGWTWEPVTTALLALTALAYLRGARELRRRSAGGRTPPAHAMWLFAAGWAALALALVSPLHALGQQLFSAHMVQHEVLMLAAAPLLALSRPLPVVLWGLPASWRTPVGALGKAPAVRVTWRFVTEPVVAWTIHGAALWVWHVPSLFESTLTSEPAHAAQHASFFGSALLFWWALVHRRADALGAGAAVLYVFTTSVHSGLLGALLTFAGTPWYRAYESTSSAWGLSALEDQQLGGLVMWVPAGMVYVAAGLLLVLAWLRDAEQQGRRRALARRAGIVVAPLLAAAAMGGTAAAQAPVIASVPATPAVHAWVTCERDGTIWIIDTATDEVVQTLEVGARPRGIELAPDARRVYVAVSDPQMRPNSELDRIFAIDPVTHAVVARYEVGSDPEEVAVARDGKRLYVANEDAGTASVIDVATGEKLATLVVGLEPEGVSVTPDGRFVYVTGETSNTIAVIDAARNEVATILMVDPRPRAVVFTHDGARAFVTAENAGTVPVIDTGTTSDSVPSVVATIAIDTPGAKPMGAVVSPDGKRVFVTNGRGNSVSVIDTETLATVGSIAVEGRPWGIEITPDGRKLYVANGLANDVAVIDVESARVVQKIAAGDGPWGVAMVPVR